MSSQYPENRPFNSDSHLPAIQARLSGAPESVPAYRSDVNPPNHKDPRPTQHFASNRPHGSSHPPQPPGGGHHGRQPPAPPAGSAGGERFAKLDGVTHINIYTLGKTELGKGLAHFTFSPFKHPYYGPFNSMEGFWYFIKAKEPDDTLRNLAGYKAKEYGKKLPGRFRENFKEIVVDANFHKIDQNPRLKQLIVESVLPFDHYYLYGPGNLLIRPKGFEWLVEGFEHIRVLLREGREPDPVNYN